MEKPEALTQFLDEYKNHVQSVLVPTRQEVRDLFRDWQTTSHWGREETKDDRTPNPSPVQRVYSRIKRPESVVDKIKRKAESFPDGLVPASFHAMTDTLGVRLVIYFLRHLPMVDRELRHSGLFEISETHRPVAYLNADLATRLSLQHLKLVQKDSGYASIHYILRLKNSSLPRSERPWFELQLRTITEHTWGEIEHVLGYKPDKRTSFAVRKQFQIIGKLLEAIDEHFNFLFEELSRFQTEVAYEDSDPLNAENLPAVLVDVGLGCAQKEIDGLLKLLVSRGVENPGTLRKIATTRTLEIVRSTYYSEKGRPPNNFEAVASLATLIGALSEAEQAEKVKAQIAFLNTWEEFKRDGLV
jgi:putative GTP pyrophosphokinase